MNPTKLLLTISMLSTSAVSRAAVTERPADAAVPVLVAFADPSVLPVNAGRLAVAEKPKSAGVAEALPDLPSVQVFSFHNVARPYPVRQTSVDDLGMTGHELPDGPGVSLLQSSPLAGTARHLGAQRFNTDDGSSIEAFAICYRLSKRASMQVIPGDPAPVKIPVSTMANNMGVTVGMVLRLSKTR